MKIDKNIVKELYNCGDRKRKKALFMVYSELILMDTSIKFIRDRINKDLGFELITESEIKYIRHHFKSKEILKAESQSPISPIKYNSHNMVNIKNDVEWTDPDEIGNNKNILKSKFSN